MSHSIYERRQRRESVNPISKRRTTNNDLIDKEFLSRKFKNLDKERRASIQKLSPIEEETINSKIRWNTMSYYSVSFYGGVSSLTELAVYYYFSIMNVQPAELSLIMALIFLPMCLKLFLGLLTDFYPIFGYKRKFYLIIIGFVMPLCWLALALEPLGPSLPLTIILLLINSVCNAFTTILAESILVDITRDNMKLIRNQKILNPDIDETESESKAQSMLSMFVFIKYVGILITSILKGSLVESLGPKTVFLLGATLPTLVLLAGILSVEDRIVKVNQRNSLASESEGKTNLVDNEEEETHASAQEIRDFVLQKKFLYPCLFVFLFMSMPSFSDPLFYFMKGKLNFSPTTFGEISLTSTIVILMGIYLFKMFFSNSEFVPVMNFSLFFTFLFTILGPYVLVKQLNVPIGIPNFWVILPANSLLILFAEIPVLPLSSLICAICPKNMEGTVFSIYESIMNVGLLTATLTGSLITKILDVKDGQFENLHIIVLINALAQLLPIIVACFIDKQLLIRPKN